MKKFLKILFVISLVLVSFSFTNNNQAKAEDHDFEADEDYYYDMCSGSNLSDEQKDACRLFRSYLADKQTKLQEDMMDLESNIDILKTNIKNEGAKIATYNEKIEKLDKQITAIKRSIDKIEVNIENLNIQIAEREARIEVLNNQIKERMVATQANIRTNSYVKFIMGATSFVDLLRRINAINEVTSYDQKKIDEMENEKLLLQADITELQSQKDNMIEQQHQLEINQDSLTKLMELTQELIDSFESQEAELIREWDQLEEDYTALDAVIGNIDKALNELMPSDGFGYFVKNKRIHITSACYYYHLTEGGFHAAIDVGNLGYGTPYYAVANGYVFASKSNCPYNGGYLGNTCNGGRGNHVFIVSQIGDKYYTIYYEHLKDVNVSVGDIVQKGQILGTSGNSGNSSGPHLHFAIYYQGTTKETTIQEIVDLYRRKGIRFGLSYTIKGSCDYRNNKAPCFMNPMEIYGYYWPNWYFVPNW